MFRHRFAATLQLRCHGSHAVYLVLGVSRVRIPNGRDTCGSLSSTGVFLSDQVQVRIVGLKGLVLQHLSQHLCPCPPVPLPVSPPKRRPQLPGVAFSSRAPAPRVQVSQPRDRRASGRPLCDSGGLASTLVSVWYVTRMCVLMFGHARVRAR